MTRVAFNVPALAGNEITYVLDAMARSHISGDGYYSKRCHALLEEALGVSRVMLTTSCTHALEMAALLLQIGPGDEVIVPSFTFVSTANAFVLRGAKPVFADIRVDTLNIDERLIEQHITPRTRAIVVVHYAGIGCEMDAISAIAKRYGIPLVEDNAHGLFAKYKGKYLGTFGCLATQSFHETKNFTCGEGGALLINEPGLVGRAEVVREKGTDRSRFFRGQVDKYSWIDVGSSYLPSDILAAFLCAQLEERARIQQRRKSLWQFYFANLQEWAREHSVGLPVVPGHCEQSFHMFYLQMPSLDERQELIADLAHRGIASVFHYLPLHLSKMGREFGGAEGDCPVTEAASDRLLRLPLHNKMTESDLADVVEAVKAFSRWRHAATRTVAR